MPAAAIGKTARGAEFPEAMQRIRIWTFGLVLLNRGNAKDVSFISERFSAS